MIRILLGIVGAIAALVYWRLTVFVNPLPLAVLLSAEWRAIGAYAIAGFLLGWALGFAISRIGGGGY
jgi:hypothetical protein